MSIPPGTRMKLCGFGRYPTINGRLVAAHDRAELSTVLQAERSLIARGNGRSYGDAALNADCVVSMLGLNRFVEFDAATGVLVCEAGILLADILRVMVPRGWFPPVSPGTQYVTVGGMVAADVHGKNAHRDGTFGKYVEWLELMQQDGTIKRCSRSCHPAWLHATIGGMGLTGVMVTVAFRMIAIRTAWIQRELYTAAGLDAAMELLDRHAHRHYTAAWIDCHARGRTLGRAVLFCGEHAEVAALPPGTAALHIPQCQTATVPLTPPWSLLSGPCGRLFNALYYPLNRLKSRQQLVDYRRFFYPLDAISGWHRLYGPRGFCQYQCVFPDATSHRGVQAVLQAQAASAQASPLAVLKRLSAGSGLMSFAMPGYTLAMDYAASESTFTLFRKLDAIVAEHGGRIYLAKDARSDELAASYPVEQFRSFRKAVDMRFNSLLAERLRL